MIDAQAPLSNNILIVHTFEFLFTSVVPGLIWEFVEFLPRGFRDEIIPIVIGDRSVAVDNCSLFELKLYRGWLTR